MCSLQGTQPPLPQNVWPLEMFLGSSGSLLPLSSLQIHNMCSFRGPQAQFLAYVLSSGSLFSLFCLNSDFRAQDMVICLFAHRYVSWLIFPVQGHMFTLYIHVALCCNVPWPFQKNYLCSCFSCSPIQWSYQDAAHQAKPHKKCGKGNPIVRE